MAAATTSTEARKGRKLYRVKLLPHEREAFEQVLASGKAAPWRRQRAQAVLKFDEGDQGPGWIDAKGAEAFDVTTRTLENWRKQAAERGPLSLLKRKPQDAAKRRKLDGVGEAQLARIACSTPPEGRKSWSLTILADELVSLNVVESIGREAVRCAMKKTRSSLGGRRCGASLRWSAPTS